MHVYPSHIQLVVAGCVCQITHQISEVNLETASQRYAETSHTLLLEGEISLYIWSFSFITIVWKNADWQTAELTKRCFQWLPFSSIHQDSPCITKETIQHTVSCSWNVHSVSWRAAWLYSELELKYATRILDMIQNRPVSFYKCAKTTDGELKFTWFYININIFPF